MYKITIKNAPIRPFSRLFGDIFVHFTNSSKIINTSGIVPIDNKCEISAIPDATVESRSYAFGITIVLRPRGIETEQIIHIANGYGTSIRHSAPMVINGMISSLTAVTA